MTEQKRVNVGTPGHCDYRDNKSQSDLKDGEPCSPGCANHVTHPCERCGRTQAKDKYKPFEREERYLVIKQSDLDIAKAQGLHSEHLRSLDIITNFINVIRLERDASPLQAVVVEADWPEYESTWQAIEQRVKQENLK